MTLRPDDFAAAVSGEEEGRYAAVRSLPDDDPRTGSSLLAALGDPSWRVRKAAVERLARLPARHELIPSLIARLGAGDDAVGRNAAAEALGAIGAPAVPALLARLDDADGDVRKFAVDVLGDLADPGTADAVATRLADADANVRAAAAEALGKIGGPRAGPHLVGALGASDALLLVSVLDALARLELAPPFEALRPLCADRFLRRSVFRLLGRTDGAGVVELLVQGLTEPSRPTREAALAALAAQLRRRDGAGRDELAAAVRRAGEGWPQLAWSCAAALASQDLHTAEGALACLAWLNRPELAPEIARVARDERLREPALAALRGLGPAACGPLREALGVLEGGARASALLVLGRLGDRDSLPVLLAAVEDEGGDEEVRRAAVEGLGGLGAPEAIPALLARLGDEPLGADAAAALLAIAASHRAGVQEAVRGAARAAPSAARVRLLGRLGDESDLPVLRAGLAAPELELRAASAAALGELGLTASAHALVRALADEHPRVRAAAARSLGALGGPPGDEVSAALEAALQDEAAEVVSSAAGALGSVGGARAIAPLRALLGRVAPRRDRLWPPAAIAAVHGLAALGDTGPEGLAPAFDADPEVIKAAASVAGVGCERLLLGSVRHPRWDVRRAAALGLARLDTREAVDELAAASREERDPRAAEALADALRALQGRG